MRLATLATSALLLLPCDPSAAAKRTITWDDEACSYRAEFDDKKYDETALRNTIGLVFSNPPVEAPTAEPVFKPEDVAKLDLDRFRAACADALARAADVRLISLPGLDAYWAATVDKIRDRCDFEIASIRAYRDPSALRDYRPAAACSRFVDALEGKTDIRQVWRDTIAESCRNNADPNQCTSRNLADGSRPDGMEWIRLFVLAFGWNNCAVKYLKINADNAEAPRTELQRRFRRLFTVKKVKCDSP